MSNDEDIPSVSPESVRYALSGVMDPCSLATGVPINLLEMGLVKTIVVGAGIVSITLRVTSPLCLQVGIIVDEVERRVGAMPNVSQVECRVDTSADWEPGMVSREARMRLRQIRPTPSARPDI